jgi:hypothetical protein
LRLLSFLLLDQNVLVGIEERSMKGVPLPALRQTAEGVLFEVQSPNINFVPVMECQYQSEIDILGLLQKLTYVLRLDDVRLM